MNRIAVFQERFFPSDVGAVVFTDEVNRRYLLDFPSSAGTLLVLPEKAYFIIDFRYFEAAQKVVNNCELILQKNTDEQMQEIFQKHQVQHVGIEDDRLTVRGFHSLQKALPTVEFVQESKAAETLNRIRTIKTSEEICRLTAAQRIAEKAFERTLNFICVGVTEKQVATELEYSMKQFGADDLSFETIAVGGKNSSLPHGVPGDYALREGDFLTMDYGVLIDGYHSDMTRTVALGAVTEEQQRVYDTVLEAQLRAIAVIRDGVTGKEVDAAARDYIENEQGYSGCFGHGLGHGIGVEIHEEPRLHSKEETPLESNMVVTVEPGIYLPGRFGVRIEDFVVVQENGCEIVTNCEKKLICLGNGS